MLSVRPHLCKDTAKTRSNHTNSKYDRRPCFVRGQQAQKWLGESVAALGVGCGHRLAVFLCRWHKWLTTAQPVPSPLECCPAPFYPRVGLSLQISNGPRSLISSRQASPLIHHLFPRRLRWDLWSVPLRASSTPASLASWLHVCVHTLPTHLSSFPDCCWLSGGLGHLMLKLLEGCHNWYPLPKLPSHSIHLRHHCQIHCAKISLKKVISFFFFFLIPDSLQYQIKTGAYNSWLFTIWPNLWAPLFFTTPFAQNVWYTWTRLCSPTRRCPAFLP